jgi:hypothetical protein
MDLAGNGKMDWFFDEYVYGTAIPSYKFNYKINGLVVDLTITQSGVDENFKMLVPVYMEVGDGKITRLGAMPISGNNTVARKIDLSVIGMKEPPKRFMLNYYDDVLAEKIE